VLSNRNCYSDPTTTPNGCFYTTDNRLRADYFSRPALDFYTAQKECAFVGGSLPTLFQLERLIAAGLPTDGKSIWVTDPFYSNTVSQVLFAAVNWPVTPDMNYDWSKSSTLQKSTAIMNFRCVFSYDI